MTDGLQRTADWARLSGGGLFRVTDAPGEITLSRRSPSFTRSVAGLVAVAAIQLLCFHRMDIWAWCWLLLVTLPVGLYVVVGLSGMLAYAGTVRLTPEMVEFRSLLGARMGTMSREGLQQIAVETGERGLVFHRFISDVGYFSAFADNQRHDAVLRNNVLIAACQQPLHLDVTDGNLRQMSAEIGMPELRLTPLS